MLTRSTLTRSLLTRLVLIRPTLGPTPSPLGLT
jgi:hypothetical protein